MEPNPFAYFEKDSILHMGLTPISDHQWIAPFSARQYQKFRDHKLNLISQDHDLVVADDQSLFALVELRQALAKHLHQHHGDIIKQCEIPVDGIQDRHAKQLLSKIALWIPDDICVLQPGLNQEEYVLTAAAVLSPSLWSAKEKFMRPITEVHGPVPSFSSKLGASVNRFFHHIKPGRPVVRFNWSLQADQTLNRQPLTEPRIQEDTPLYYRSERQTLLRLADSKAVAFFIRTEIYELSELAVVSGNKVSLEQFLQHVDALDESERQYKGLDKLQVALGKYR